MELSNSNIKKFLKFSYISGNENPKKLLIFWKMEIFIPSSIKEKKFIPPKNSLCIRKSNFLTLILKKFLYFWKWNPALFSPSSKSKNNPPRENFLYFSKRKPRKNFSQERFFYFLGNRNPKTELSYISGGTSRAPKTKIYYIFLKKVMNNILKKHFWIIVSKTYIN